MYGFRRPQSPCYGEPFDEGPHSAGLATPVPNWLGRIPILEIHNDAVTEPFTAAD